MRKILLVVGFAVILFAVSAPAVQACGDKFLVGNSVARFNGFLPAVPPSTILIYAGQGGQLDEWAQERAGLEANGHTVVVQNHRTEMLDAISSGDYDVVMLEVADARELRGDIESASADTIVLPYINLGTKSERTSAKDEFGTVVKTPTTPKKLTRKVESVLAVALTTH